MASLVQCHKREVTLDKEYNHTLVICKVSIEYYKPGLHCHGIQPLCVPVSTPGPTGTTTLATLERTALNLDKPC